MLMSILFALEFYELRNFQMVASIIYRPAHPGVGERVNVGVLLSANVPSVIEHLVTCLKALRVSASARTCQCTNCTARQLVQA
jgi:hypothetical protein